MSGVRPSQQSSRAGEAGRHAGFGQSEPCALPERLPISKDVGATPWPPKHVTDGSRHHRDRGSGRTGGAGSNRILRVGWWPASRPRRSLLGRGETQVRARTWRRLVPEGRRKDGRWGLDLVADLCGCFGRFRLLHPAGARERERRAAVSACLVSTPGRRNGQAGSTGQLRWWRWRPPTATGAAPRSHERISRERTSASRGVTGNLCRRSRPDLWGDSRSRRPARSSTASRRAVQ